MYLVLTVCFVFDEYVDHRDLHVLIHSFPTRRSSDLAQCLRFRNVSLIARRFRLEGLPGQCGLPWPSVNVARQETKMPKLKTKSGVKKRFKLKIGRAHV